MNVHELAQAVATKQGVPVDEVLPLLTESFEVEYGADIVGDFYPKISDLGGERPRWQRVSWDGGKTWDAPVPLG